MGAWSALLLVFALAFVLVLYVVGNQDTQQAARLQGEPPPSVAGEPTSPLDRQRVAAERLYREQDYDAAREAFATLREAYREAGDASASRSMYNNMGLCWYKQGLSDEAEPIFREITTTHPGYVRAWTNLGLVLEDLSRFEEAVEAYRQALRVEPGNRKAQRALEELTGEQSP